jgi:hypothetical protein
MADEEWYCPRRAPYGMDQWRKPEGGDQWSENRWTGLRVTYSRSEGGVTLEQRVEPQRFPASWQPRVCSFCGGAHPEDVLRLIAEGWEVEPSLKGYKGYLHPPGYTQSMQGAMRKMGRGMDPIRALAERPSVSDPTPPVKIYAQHFSPAQLEELNRGRCD